jgi:ribosomal protein S18 acetylase RimI-like enzyme
VAAAPEIREVEAVAYRSWPAKEIEVHDGWELRFSDGFSRRANSVYPAAGSQADHETQLEWCRDWYMSRGLELVIRQSPTTEEGLDSVLEDLGFTEEGRTYVMVADLDASFSETAEVVDQPSAIWWQAMADLWGIGENREDAWRSIVNRIDLLAGFGIAIDGEGPGGAGLGVVDGVWLGLFEVIVAPASRRRGIGSELTRSLMGWGRSRGAERAFLQVVSENARAISMYERLGFRKIYSYWYRRAPTGFYT